MSDLNLVLRIRANADGTLSVINSTTRGIRDIEDQANRSGAAVDNLAGHLRSMVYAAAALVGLNIGTDLIKDTILLADGMTLLTSRVKIATSSLADYGTSMTALTALSMQTGTSLDANATLFARINKAIEGMGGSINDTLGLTKELAQAIKISGASAGEAASLTVQLSQALSSGVLRGDEFNSIMENGARVVDALSAATGKSRGELRKMAEEGELSAQLVVNALQSQAAAIDRDFAKIPLTVGAAFENIQTALRVYINESNNAIAGTSNLAGMMDSLAKNLKQVAELGKFAGETIAIVMLSKAIPSVTAYIAAQIQAISMSRAHSAAITMDLERTVALTASRAAQAQAELAATQATLAGTSAGFARLAAVEANIAATRAYAVASASATEAQTALNSAMTAGAVSFRQLLNPLTLVNLGLAAFVGWEFGKWLNGFETVRGVAVESMGIILKALSRLENMYLRVKAVVSGNMDEFYRLKAQGADDIKQIDADINAMYAPGGYVKGGSTVQNAPAGNQELNKQLESQSAAVKDAFKNQLESRKEALASEIQAVKTGNEQELAIVDSKLKEIKNLYDAHNLTVADYYQQRADLIGQEYDLKITALKQHLGLIDQELSALRDPINLTISANGLSGQIKAFYTQFGDAAKKAGEQLGVSAAAILGQWGNETGWGKSIIPGTNNLGNIKDFSGAGVKAKDNQTGSLDAYKTYASLDDFVASYVSLIKRKYKDAVGAKTAAEFATALKAGGYAEDKHYVQKVTAAAANFNTSDKDSESVQKRINELMSKRVDLQANLNIETLKQSSALKDNQAELDAGIAKYKTQAQTATEATAAQLNQLAEFKAASKGSLTDDEFNKLSTQYLDALIDKLQIAVTPAELFKKSLHELSIESEQGMYSNDGYAQKLNDIALQYVDNAAKLGGLVSPQQAYDNALAASNQLLSDGNITVAQYNKLIDDQSKVRLKASDSTSAYNREMQALAKQELEVIGSSRDLEQYRLNELLRLGEITEAQKQQILVRWEHIQAIKFEKEAYATLVGSAVNAFDGILAGQKTFSAAFLDVFDSMIKQARSRFMEFLSNDLLSGNWLGVFKDVLGIGVSYAAQYLRKSNDADPVDAVVAAQNTNMYGITDMYRADVIGRDIYQHSALESVRQWNAALNDATALLKQYSGKITELGGQLLTKMLGNISQSFVGKLIATIKAPFEAAYHFVVDGGTKLMNGIGSSVSQGISALFSGGAAAATVAPMGFAGLQGGSVAGAWSAGIASSQTTFAGAAQAADAASAGASASSAMGAYLGMFAQFLAVVKLGFDLVEIAGNKFTTTMEKVSAGFKAAESASWAFLTIPVVGWIAGAVLHVFAAATQQLSGDWLGGLSYAFGGHIGEMIANAFKPKPSATMLSYSTANPESKWDASGDYFTSTGPQSASIGVKTPFGYLDARLNDVGNVVGINEVKAAFLGLLQTTQKFDIALGASIDQVDTYYGQSGTLAKFNAQLKKFEPEKPLKGLDSNAFAVERFDMIGKGLSNVDTIAGKTAGTWITAFSKVVLDPKKPSALQVFNVEDFVTKNLLDFTKMPLTLANLFVKNVKSIADGATQEQFLQQFTDFFTGWEIANQGLKSMGTDIQNTAIPDYLASLIGLGFTVKESAINLVTYAKALQGAGEYTNETLNNIINGLLNAAKDKKYSKDQTSGFISSAVLFGGMSAEMGFKSVPKDIEGLSSTLVDLTNASIATANAEIDRIINTEKLTGITRDAAIEQLVLSGKLDASKVASADFGKALIGQQKIYIDAMAIFIGIADIADISIARTGVSFKSFAENAVALTEQLGGVDKATSRLMNTFKASMGESNFLYGSAVADRKKAEQIYAQYGVNDQNVDQAYQLAIASKDLTVAQKAEVQAAYELVLQSRASKKAYDDNTASLRNVVSVALAPLDNSLAHVNTTGVTFTHSVNDLSKAFGSAENASKALGTAMKVAYKPNEIKTKTYNAAQNEFNDAAAAVGLQGLNPEDFRAGLRWLQDNKILTGKINYQGITLDVPTLLDSGAQLLDNLDTSKAALNGGDSAASSANQAYEDAQSKANDNAKTLRDLNADITKQLAGLKLSDMQKSIFDINTAIADMVKQAADASGTLPEIEKLRAAKLQDLAAQTFKDPIKQYSRIGNTDLQNQLLDIGERFAKLTDEAKQLAAASPNLSQYLTGTLAGLEALKQDEIAKVAKGIFDEPVKQFKRLGNTDLQNSLADIAENFDELRQKAIQLAAASPALAALLPNTLAGLDQLEKAQKQKLFKDLVDEFNAIGKSNVQKSLDGVYQWMQDTLKIAPELAAAYGISMDAAQSGIKAIALERAKVAAGWDSIMEEYSNIGKTDAEKQVNAANKAYDEAVNSLFSTFNMGLINSDELMDGLNIAMSVFQSRIKSLTDQVDESNGRLLTKAGMGPNQAALDDIIRQFKEQKSTIAAVSQAPAVSKTNNSSNFAELTQFNQVKSNFASWVKGWDPNGVNAQFSEFIRRINQLTNNADIDALAGWVGQQAGTGPATAQWISDNSSMLFHFESILRDAAQALAYVSTPSSATNATTATITQSNSLNDAALRQSVFNWFKGVNTDFDNIGRSDYRKALDSIDAELNDWLAGINDAVGALGNTAEYQAMAFGARNQIQAVAQAKKAALDLQYRQPLLDKIYTLSHSKEDALSYTRKQALAAMDASLRPLQEMVNKLEDMREAATKTQDAIKSATDTLTQMINTLQGEVAGTNTYSGAKTLLQTTLANAQQGNFENIDNIVKNLSALTQDQSKLFSTAADYRRDQQGVINSLTSLNNLSDQHSTALNTIVVPGYASGGDHAGGWRVVGENGPELEFTGPSHIYNHNESSRLLNQDELIQYVKELTDVVKQLCDENKQIGIQIVKHTKKTADLAEKDDAIGTPPVRA